jgi:hypothetical protein
MQPQSTPTIREELLVDHNQDLPAATASDGASSDDRFPPPGESDNEPPVDLPRLRAALACLDPDCDERTWMVYRIGALANTAQEYPDLRGQLYELAWQFSSGMLVDKPAQTWIKRGEHGSARRHRLAKVWQRFMRSTYSGTRVKIESIYFHARKEGWDGEAFEEEAL